MVSGLVAPAALKHEALAPSPGAEVGVSIVIPAFNASATLAHALASLRRQTLSNWQAIVVDDGSQDDTAAIADRWARRDPRITCLRQENRGVAAARNLGLAHATQDWILFLDADDWLTPGALARLTQAAQASPHAGVTVGRTLRATSEGRRWPFARCDLSDPFALLCCEGPIPIHSALVRRQLVADAGGFDVTLRTSEDWDLWQRLARSGVAFAQTDAVVAIYRSVPGSLSKQVTQVTADALTVMRRGHATDPRVGAPHPLYAEGGPKDALPSRELYFVLWSTARAVAMGEDPLPLIGMLERPLEAGFEPSDAGELMAAGIADLLGQRPSDLGRRWPEFAPGLEAIFRALDPAGARQRACALALATIKARLNGGADGDADVLQLGREFSDVAPDSDFAVFQVRAGGRTLGIVAAPALGPLDAAHLADVAATQAGRLPLASALRAARPWVSGAFWPPLVRWLANPRGLALVGQRRNPARLKQIVRHRLRHALAAGLQSAVRQALRPRPGSQVTDGHGDRVREICAAFEAAAPAEGPAAADASGIDGGRRPAAVEDAGAWDAFFTADDPWNYGGSQYERQKYEDTLELIPEIAGGTGLELACAEGHFTTRLAARVGRLLATDISATALERARARAEGAGNVDFRQLDFMRQPIPGAYDLIVCSEVLYYAGDRLRAVAAAIAERLKPGGLLVMAHADQIADEPDKTGFDWGHSYGARTIGDVFSAVDGLTLEREIRRPLYRVQAFRKATATGAAPQVDVRPLGVELERHVARNVVWGGGVSRIATFGREVATSVPILMYHRIAAEGPSALARYRVSPDAFEAQMSCLRRNGYWGVTPQRLLEALTSNRPLPGRPVMITFDDGYVDFLEHAWPVLKRHDFEPTLFIVPEKVGATADWDSDVAEAAPLLDWPQIRDLAAEGVHIESHGSSHRALTDLAVAEIYREVLGASSEILRRTGRATTAICYPYGSADPIVEQVAEECGYRLGFSVRPGHATLASHPFRLPRVEISGFDDMDAFIRKVGVPT